MLSSFLLTAGLLLSAQPDTLQAVTVVADRGVVVSRTDTLFIRNNQDVSSTLLQLPGVYVGDYGGTAGLKSASLRGFGSAHTAIYLDGVRVSNIQSGQADLGMLDLQSLGSVVADYAQNSLSFQTARPVFNGRKVSGTARLQGGSFGTWQPYGRINFSLDERWALSANVGAVLYQGNFPLETGNLRVNNDLKQVRGGLDLFGLLQGGDFHAKVYYNKVGRGTPGSVDWPSTDRQSDDNLLAQAVFRKSFTPVYTLHLSGKAAFDKLFYQSEWGDSQYRQADFQLNSAHYFQIGERWTASLAADASLDTMGGDVYERRRFQTVTAAAIAYHSARLKAKLAVEYNGQWDRSGSSWHVVSPSADLRVKLVEGLDILAFGRRGYRAPTFNELYYPGFGNPALKPEDGWISDLGLDFHRTLDTWTLDARADGYYNWLTNKIISAPSADDPNVWLPYNVGKVQSMGADLQAGFVYAKGNWKAAFHARYGWQQALDKTPDSYTYDQQIPYVARHTLVLSGKAAWKGWTLSALWNQRMGRWDANGKMPNWETLDITFNKDFQLGKGMALGAFVSGKNILNYRYDIISGYPMPGINFLAGIQFRF